MSVNDGIDSRLIFRQEDDPLRFRVGEPGPKSRGLASVVGGGDRLFGASELRHGFCDERPEQVETRDHDGDDDVDDDDDDEERNDVDGGVQRRDALIRPGVDSGDNCGSVAAEADAETGKPGSTARELVVREDETGKSSIDGDEMYPLKKDMAASIGSWDSLKAILSDPVTGALMDDAMILPCGHSFGAGGIEKVKRMKACCTCSQPVSEDSVKPNLSLRVVVRAFRQEEDSEHSHLLKRRKERSDQDKRTFYIPTAVETPKSRGIQFPFSIGDRVIIKGNKRTPPRFVGRRAVIMTHCLNGWYVVKTLDNAECIKLQHCSLAKISDDSFGKVTLAQMAPSWL